MPDHPSIEACRNSLNETGELNLHRTVHTLDLKKIREAKIQINDIRSKSTDDPNYKLTASDKNTL